MVNCASGSAAGRERGEDGADSLNAGRSQQAPLWVTQPLQSEYVCLSLVRCLTLCPQERDRLPHYCHTLTLPGLRWTAWQCGSNTGVSRQDVSLKRWSPELWDTWVQNRSRSIFLNFICVFVLNLHLKLVSPPRENIKKRGISEMVDWNVFICFYRSSS